MSESEIEELRAVAIEVAELAAEHVRRRRRELFGAGSHDAVTEDGASTASSAVSTKTTPTDPVTVADTETEQLIRERLHQLRPDDEVLGEEAGGSIAVPRDIRWVVDPIDGTVNFMYGVPAYAVSVAAQRAGRSVAGAVVDVARGVTYFASLGGGAWARDAEGVRALRASGVTDVGLALVATGFAYDAGRRRAQGEIVAQLLPRIRDIRRIGAAALDLCMVADGRVDAHYEHGLSPWDWAAGGLIASEAGAVVTTPPADSRATQGHVTLAIAPGIAEAFGELLDEVGATRSLPD